MCSLSILPTVRTAALAVTAGAPREHGVTGVFPGASHSARRPSPWNPLGLQDDVWPSSRRVSLTT